MKKYELERSEHRVTAFALHAPDMGRSWVLSPEALFVPQACQERFISAEPEISQATSGMAQKLNKKYGLPRNVSYHKIFQHTHKESVKRIIK